MAGLRKGVVDSIREVKARFAEAAAARGERVVVTKHGRPFVELVPAAGRVRMDFERAAAVRLALGIDGATVAVPGGFDDAAFSRQVLGLEERGCCSTRISRFGRRWRRRR